MRVFKNFIYNVAYQILIMILPIITAPYIARVLGAEKIGIYSYIYSISYYFLIFAQLGFNLYGNRLIASVRDDKKKLNKTFSSIYFLQVIISSIVIVCYILFVEIFVKEYKSFYIIQFAYVVSNFFDISWFYFGIEKFKITVIRNVCIKILTVLCILIFVKTTEDLWIYFLIMSVGVLIGQLILWFNIHKYVKIVKCELRECLKHFKMIFLLFLPTIATSIYRVMDKIMLGNMFGMDELGFYESSEKFIAISMGVINALGTVMIPRISNLVANNENEKVKKYIYQSIEGIYILAFPIVFGLAGIANILSIVFYGNDFSRCGDIIPVLAISIIFSTWANVIRTQYLIPYNRDKEYIISMFLGAGVNFIVNIILIPQIGAIGAAIGTVCAELSVAVVHSIYVFKELDLLIYLKLIWKYSIIAFIMYQFVINILNFMDISIISLLIAIFSASLVYILFTLIFTCIFKTQFFYIVIDFFKKRLKR